MPEAVILFLIKYDFNCELIMCIYVLFTADPVVG